MSKRIELMPKAEIGSGYAIVDDSGIEIRISGVMGALKAWLIGDENLAIGNIVGGRLRREIDTAGCRGILITQSGKQMFYGELEAEDRLRPDKEEKPLEAENSLPASPYDPLPDMNWKKITDRSFPTTNDRVRFVLSNRAFFEAFKKHGYYLFGRDGERLALAIKHIQGDPAPFPNISDASEAGEYMYVLL